MVLLNNKQVLPLTVRVRKYLSMGLSVQTMPPVMATVVESPEQADVIILYLDRVFNGNQAPGSEETY